MSLLFRGLIGSRMYGLDHADSDYDYYEVWSEIVESRKAVQTVNETEDVTRVSLSRFLLLAMNGSHQALDAMFTPYVEVDKISALRNGFYAGGNVLSDFDRIIKELVAQQNIPKKRMHAVRIAYNMNELHHTGRYNPVLTPQVIKEVKRVSELDGEAFVMELKSICSVLDL